MSASVVRRIVLTIACFALFTCTKREEPLKVSLCQIVKNPRAYDHKLLEVSALVSHGFEDFTLFDAGCSSWPNVWLEYGGTASAGTVYWGGSSASRDRRRPTVIENIPIPLVEDELFQELDRRIHQERRTVIRATIVGRFFSGDKNLASPDDLSSGGYGHMGCCSLFAIQQVRSVEPRNRTDLDYRSSVEESEVPERVGCISKYVGLSDPITAQMQAEHGPHEWSFTDPQRVAIDALARYLEIDPGSIRGITQVRHAPGRVVHQWKPRGSQKTYLVVTSRPHWLSYLAKDPQRVAWVTIGVQELTCK